MKVSIFLLDSPFLPILFLIGSMLITACYNAFNQLGRFKSKHQIRSPWFFFRPIFKSVFCKNEWDNLYFFLSISKNIYLLAYASFAFFYLISSVDSLHRTVWEVPSTHHWPPILIVAGIIILLSLIADFIARVCSSLWSSAIAHAIAPIVSFYLMLLFPITAPLLKLTRALKNRINVNDEEPPTDKAKLREAIFESDLQNFLDSSDKKLINSFLNFKERVAKEIMVPRVDLFALPVETTLKDATALFAEEGYSRIPIYRDTLDQIIGVVLYKDLLKTYADPHHNLSVSLEGLAKPVIYSPENKKITQLLQEFRTKQIHMAIIVDEYGGTEGIITIEDILEELVGEIEDEYDIGGDLFWPLHEGGWIVDAKMSINDIYEQLGIRIPESPEYETIGGYVFHRAGTIPARGWLLKHDEFELEVLSSNERSIKKIKIIPRSSPLSEEEPG